MEKDFKEFLIRLAIFIILLLLIIPFFRHLFVQADHRITVVYYTERISIIIGIFTIVLFLMTKDKLAEIKIEKENKRKFIYLLFLIIALLLFLCTFMLEVNFENHLNMDTIKMHKNSADIGYGWILGEKIYFIDDSMNSNIIENPIRKEFIFYVDNDSIKSVDIKRVFSFSKRVLKEVVIDEISDNLTIRWNGAWYGSKNFTAIMLVNNKSYDITSQYLAEKEGKRHWMEVNISKNDLINGTNEFILMAKGNANKSKATITTEVAYDDIIPTMTEVSIKGHHHDWGLFLYRVHPYNKFLKTAIDFKFLIKIAAVIFLFLACLGPFAKIFIYKRVTIIAAIFSLIIYYSSTGFSLMANYFSINLYSNWEFFSRTGASISYYILRTISEYAVFDSNDITLGIHPFIVKINKDCSGIEGLSFFAMTFIIISAFEWKKINKAKMFLIFPFGLIGMFLTNVLRITSIIIVGRYISQEFAVTTFHSNIGWILFIVYFMIFWYLSYNWLMKK
ncbi:MAG: archaeosortase/exosortase family protein [Candidatus Pacearchaeota archaeon]